MTGWNELCDKAIRSCQELYDEIDARAKARVPAYTVVWCVGGQTVSVPGLTHREAWRARDLHAVEGHTAWVEAE